MVAKNVLFDFSNDAAEASASHSLILLEYCVLAMISIVRTDFL